MPGHFNVPETEDGAFAETKSSSHVGVFGSNGTSDAPAGGGAGGAGVFGLTLSPGAAGVFGANNGPQGVGVYGVGPEVGVSGFSEQGNGLRGASTGDDGAFAATRSSSHVGVFGSNETSDAPAGGGAGGAGVFGLTLSPGAAGVFGANNAAAGPGRGVQGNGPEAGVAGYSAQGVGVLAQSGKIGIKAQAPIAGHFDGDVEVTGDIRLMGGDDCAENFDVCETGPVECGSLMVAAHGGGVSVSEQEYDPRVAGVVSGAGSHKPAMILGDQSGPREQLPLALMGRVYCKVDATEVPVSVGDMLTTSSTPGHAMKAIDRTRAFGAVIGKALQPCAGERGLIAILVALQ